MELLSLDGGERYHTLAALVEIGTDGSSEFLLTGFVPEEKRGRISRIMHEVTHVASLRTTRLGFWVARVASRALGKNSNIANGKIEIPTGVQQVLGAFAPLLEGLALYGQLDYEADNDANILPFPLNKIAANNTSDVLISEGVRTAMQSAKLAVIWEGILSALFMDPCPETEHYFAGYLYIKAVAAKLARLAPGLAAPTTALPLLVRLICDHPVVERLAVGDLSTEQIIQAVLYDLHDLTERDVCRISEMLQRSDVRESFDNWDIHAQLASSDDHPMVLHSEMNPLFDGLLDNESFLNFRAATSVHLTSWTAGLITSLGFENGASNLVLSDMGCETTVKIMCHSAMNAFREHLDERSLFMLENFEDIFMQNLNAAYHMRVPVAIGSYVTLTKGNTGLVLWVEDRLSGIIPLSLLDNQLNQKEVEIALEGLKLSPVFRRRFAHALRSNDSQAEARGKVNDAIIAALVSNPEWRPVVLRGRLGAVPPMELHTALEAWCEQSLSPGGPDQFDCDLATRLGSVFDRPSLGGGPFGDLLPDFTSLRAFLIRRQS